jgi:transcriptional regulator with XRE-family HTH domain
MTDTSLDSILWYLNTDKLHQLRERRQLTSRQLFDQAGLDISMLDRWEWASVSIAPADVTALATVLGVSKDALVMFAVSDLKQHYKRNA